MPITKSVLDNGRGITLKVSGRFDLLLNRDLQKAYSGTARPGMIYRLDLADVSYIDSSALDLIISLQQYASQHGAKVKLINPSPVASKALELALFNDSFDIRHE